MQKWQKWTLGVFGVLMLAIGTVVVLFDWNWLRSPVSGVALSQTGRGLRIGNIQGEWAWRPRFRIDDVHFGNADWAKGEDMFAAERVEFVVDLRALLTGDLILPEIMLVKPKIHLERGQDGRTNWSLGAQAAAEAVTPDERQEMPLIGRLIIEDGTLAYRDPIAGLDLNGRVATATGTGGEGAGAVRFQGRGMLQGEPFTLNLTGGSLITLREGEDPYPLTIDFVAGESRAQVSGTLDEPIKFEGLNLNVRLQGPNLAKLTTLTGVPLPLTPSYDLQARLEREKAVWTLDKLVGRMGHSDLSGRLKIDNSNERLFIDADLTSKRLDYRDVGTLIGIPPESSAAQSAPKQKSQQDKKAQKPADVSKPAGPPPRVLPDAPLAIQQVREVDARVKFKGEKVEAPNTPLDAVDLSLDLRDGVLKLAPLSLGVAGGRATANIQLDARTNAVKTDYDIRLSAFRLERFLADAGVPNAGDGRIDGRIKLTGMGDSVRKSLATANGNVRLIMNQGNISNLALELVGLDVAQSLGFLMGGDKNVPIRCLVGDIAVVNGVMQPQMFMIDTTDTTVNVSGEARLGQEILDLRVTAHPKDTTIFSARTPIRIGGHFSRPSMGVEAVPLGARAGGAVLLGVLFTPLASILAFIEPGLQEDADCAKLLQERPVR